LDIVDSDGEYDEEKEPAERAYVPKGTCHTKQQVTDDKKKKEDEKIKSNILLQQGRDERDRNKIKKL
jgi:hypothetical protein